MPEEKKPTVSIDNSSGMGCLALVLGIALLQSWGYWLRLLGALTRWLEVHSR